MPKENMIELEGINQPIYSKDLPEKRIAEITFDGYKNKLKGRLYGLLCEREKDGEWKKFLESIILELQGLGANSINWWPLMGKLNLLPYLSYIDMQWAFRYRQRNMFFADYISKCWAGGKQNF